MQRCKFCGRALPSSGDCSDCGKLVATGAAILIYGKAAPDLLSGDFYLTERKLLIRHQSAGYFFGQMASRAMFGAVGSLVFDSATKVKPEDIAGFRIENVHYIIYPYRNIKLKKNKAVKIVNKDGTDCILSFDTGSLMDGKRVEKYMEAFDGLGIPIKDGFDWDFGDRYCDHPFLGPRRMMGRNEAPAFCACCGSRLSLYDAFCGACGRKVDD